VAENPASSFERATVDLLLRLAEMHPDEVGPAIIEAGEALGAWDIEVLIVDVNQRAMRSLAPRRPGDDDTPVNGSLAGRCYQEQRIVEAGAVENGRRLFVPILDSSERVGVLAVNIHTDVVLDHLRALASLAGEILVTKSTYGDSITRTRRSKDMTLAAELRWAMLPPLTFASPRIDIAGILEPAYDIAGDTFDYAVNGDVAHFAVFDAMGHGLEASRIANLAVGSYRNSRRRDAALGETLLEMDQVVSTQIGEHRFVTAQLGTVDLKNGLLRLLNAGHPPPLLLHGGIDAGDVPCEPCLPVGLGAVPTSRTELALQPDDVVVLYTDGVTEARNEPGEFFGRDRLVATIEASMRVGHPRAETLRIVAEALMAFRAGELDDDASLVLVSWRPNRR
jgi:serine/threonine protein phosphatase PrpC